VTEVGRQPWVVYQQLRTADAVTHAGGIWISYGIIVALHTALAVAAILVLRSMSRRWRDQDGADATAVPYGPPPDREVELTP
jgi:cytochrome bd ubiquinol oxidase subunit I